MDRKQKANRKLGLKAHSQWLTFSRDVPPPKDSATFTKNPTIRELSVQILEAVGDISHSNHNTNISCAKTQHPVTTVILHWQCLWPLPCLHTHSHAELGDRSYPHQHFMLLWKFQENSSASPFQHPHSSGVWVDLSPPVPTSCSLGTGTRGPSGASEELRQLRTCPCSGTRVPLVSFPVAVIKCPDQSIFKGERVYLAYSSKSVAGSQRSMAERALSLIHKGI